MVNIEIYDDTWNKLQEFKKVVIAIVDDNSVENDSDYVDLVLKQGIQKMIRDILPQEESTLTKDILNMFDENPKYISQHIFNNLEKGKKLDESQQIKEKWDHFQ